MIAMLVDSLPVSFDKFATVSGTSLNGDTAIMRPCQNATCPQPKSAGDELGSARLPAAGGSRSSTLLAANMPDSDPFTPTRRQPNPVNMKMSRLWVPAGDPIRYRRRSKPNSPSGAAFWATRLTPSCATRIES
jgi:hypothetical protein